MKQLSSKLSEAIKQALADLDACKNDERYNIDFHNWYNPNVIPNTQFEDDQDKKCSVCFAGAIMAKTLLSDDIQEHALLPDDFPEHERMLNALDDVRAGGLHSALLDLNIDIPDKMELDFHVDQTNYKNFIRDIKTIVRELEKFKL